MISALRARSHPLSDFDSTNRQMCHLIPSACESAPRERSRWARARRACACTSSATFAQRSDCPPGRQNTGQWFSSMDLRNARASETFLCAANYCAAQSRGCSSAVSTLASRPADISRGKRRPRASVLPLERPEEIVCAATGAPPTPPPPHNE